ncbi:helix-turn-helix transcriptional regulator [Actinomadura fibrosa]|uniref:Helix-turn-helix transcriptional regulator n=1 Tax=Actinomadura fibrosa TaxID=111802 RepID=A0ABW2XGW7_9ACTN|nr:helix-turn-helix transcriptional regulator [Actinomadura fibrosa]
MTAETPQSGTGPHRISFATRDPGLARDFIDRAYSARLRIGTASDTRWQVDLTQIDAGPFTTGDVTLPIDMTFKLEGRDEVIVNTLVEGRVGYDSGKGSDRFGPGDVFLGARPRSETIARTHQMRVRTVVLPHSLLTAATGAAREDCGTPWEFLSPQPRDDHVQQWHRTTEFVDGLLADPTAAASPLLIGPVARLLAATALAVFPNSAISPPTRADRTDAHPAALRRAIAFIETHPDTDVALPDIASAAGVTPRAVQLAFRRHCDTTPMGYLRQVRLEQAHRQLSDAVPGDGTTVTAVAARWGFYQPSRFAALYRRRYGRLPSQTLHR